MIGSRSQGQGFNKDDMKFNVSRIGINGIRGKCLKGMQRRFPNGTQGECLGGIQRIRINDMTNTMFHIWIHGIIKNGIKRINVKEM